MRIRLTLATLLALFALLTLFDRFVLLEMLVLRTTLPLLAATAVALACIGTGAIARGTDEADAPLDLLLGYPLFGTICFLVGTVRIAGWVMGMLVVIGAAAGVLVLLAGWKSANDPTSPRTHTWALFAVMAVMVCGFVTAQAPPSSLDELAYHLAVPHAWVNDGRVVALPLLSQSNFPLGIESADLPALAILGPTGGGMASHFLHLFAAIATTLVIARRTGSWLVTAAIVTTPALAIAAGWSLVDWPLTGLFVVLFLAMERDDVRMASVATAAGLLTKYTFLPFAIVAWAIKRKRPHWIALAGLVFFVRNLFLTGNPFAPFFAADAPHVSGFRALALADYVFEGAFLDEALGVAILALPAFAVGALPIACALIALALLLFLTPSSRILVPFLVVPSLAATDALRRRWLAALIGTAVIVQTFFVVWFTARGGAFSLLAGGVSERDYLRAQRPSYAAIESIDGALPQDSRTLVIGTGETFWFTRPVRGGGNFDGPRMSRYLDVPTPEALRARLRADGITHVVLISAVVPTKVEQKIEERQTTLSPAAQRMLAVTLNRYAASLTSRSDATLFTLR